MSHKIFATIALLSFFLTACASPTPTPTPKPVPPTATAIPSATTTPLPTATAIPPTATVQPTATIAAARPTPTYSAIAAEYVGLVFKAYADFAFKDYDRAIGFLDQAVKLMPNESMAYSARGEAYKLKGDKAKAIADFEMYIKLAPNASDRAQVEQWLRELKGQ